MGKENLYDAFSLCVVLIASLLLLFTVPDFNYGPITYKRIDLFSDFKVFEETREVAAAMDSIIVSQDSVKKIVEEKCRPGMTCIEDYSRDSTALKFFADALSGTKTSGRPLRIAFYGDSFIEGDVLCGSFRDTLQNIFGGQGVGFVPITSAVSGFRNTVRHSFANWQTTSLIAPQRNDPVGPAGYSYIPLSGNWVYYRGIKQRNLSSFSVMKLYYQNSDSAAVQFTFDNDSFLHIDELKISRSLQEWTYRQADIRGVKFEFYPFDSLRVYGASFESEKGVYVDNFSIRGNSGISLSRLDDDLLRRFAGYRDYKLVILQFGINGMTEDSLNYAGYTKRMVQVVNKLKKAMPKTSFLLLSVGDRSTNRNGKVQTMNAVPAMRNAQRAIARRTNIAFWDMFEAMGGENSMVKFVQSRPPLGAKDYTHLTFKGGSRIAGLLAKSLLFEFEKQEKRKEEAR